MATIKQEKSYQAASTFVPALRQRQELPVVQVAPPSIIDLLPQATHTARTVDENDAMTHARATLLVSAAYIAAAGMITGGLLLIAWLFRALGDAWGAYTYTGLIIWGLCVLGALWGNRRQSLWHSPTGIAHHELDSRERLAKHAIDTHADLLRRRWELDRHD